MPIPITNPSTIPQVQIGGDNKKVYNERNKGHGQKGKKKTKNQKNPENQKVNKNKSQSEMIKNCMFMSVPYNGSSLVTDSLTKISVVLPWYEYSLYVFRNETHLQKLCVPEAYKNAPLDHVSSVKEALLVLDYIKKNLMFLNLERTKLSNMNSMSKRVPYIDVIFPGFFLDTRNTSKPVAIEAIPANELRIQSAMTNRSLEYGYRTPIDKFLIVHNEFFRQVVGGTISIDTDFVSEVFSQLNYDMDTDQFGMVFGNEGVVVLFRIVDNGSYPQPEVVMVSNITNAKDTGINNITLIEGDAFVNLEMISTWIENDGLHLETWYEPLHNYKFGING
jgi:hypothetical protein